MGVLRIVVGVLTGLPGIIHAAESLFGANKGPDKKQYVMEIVTAFLGLLPTVAPGLKWDTGAVQGGVGKLIDGLVDVFNATGIFTKA